MTDAAAQPQPDAPGSPSRATPSGERDAAGRFLPGNTTSRLGGGPAAKATAAHRAAARAAVSPDEFGQLLRKMLERGLAGDVPAARFVAEYLIGRARQSGPDEPIDLPGIDTPAGIAATLQLVARAVAAGQLDASEASAIVGALIASRAGSDDAGALEKQQRMRAFLRDAAGSMKGNPDASAADAPGPA